jgi:cephalosporin hydroxylase
MGTLARLLRPIRRWYRVRYEVWLIRNFNRLYYDGPYGGRQLFKQVKWLGVSALKAPTDLWVYQEIIFKTRPDLIVEIGVKAGGSTLYLASVLDLLGAGRILACDLTLQGVHESVRRHGRIELIEGDSVSREVYEAVRSRCAGLRTMVILDSDHHASHVLEELRLYAPLVTPGCYLICEDTNINGHPVRGKFGPGPYEAVQEFLQQHPEWRVDKGKEKLLVTFNPSGYLFRESD